MNRPSPRWEAVQARWRAMAAREKTLVALAVVVVLIAVAWMILLGPAVSTLRDADRQHRVIDAQLQRMRSLQSQAQSLQSQPKQSYDDAVRLLELSVRQRLGAAGRVLIAGDRATVTLTGAGADALAQWLTQARVNARALPGEAHLSRNAAGQWEGTLVLTLPPR